MSHFFCLCIYVVCHLVIKLEAPPQPPHSFPSSLLLQTWTKVRVFPPAGLLGTCRESTERVLWPDVCALAETFAFSKREGEGGAWGSSTQPTPLTALHKSLQHSLQPLPNVCASSISERRCLDWLIGTYSLWHQVSGSLSGLGEIIQQREYVARVLTHLDKISVHTVRILQHYNTDVLEDKTTAHSKHTSTEATSAGEGEWKTYPGYCKVCKDRIEVVV